MVAMLSAFVLRLLSLVTIGCASAAGIDSFNVSEYSYGDTSWTAMFESILKVLVASAPVVAGTVFIAGAFFFAISSGKEDMASRGKSLMIDALVGYAVVVAALGIVKVTAYMIWGHSG